MTHPKEPLWYKTANMHKYVLSYPYKNTYIINPYNSNLELDLLLYQFGFFFVFSRRIIKPGLNVILFCSATCLKPNRTHTMDLAGLSMSYDLLPLSPEGIIRFFLVVKRSTPSSLRELSMAQTLNAFPQILCDSQFLQSINIPQVLRREMGSMPVNILNSRSTFLGHLTAYLEFASCWFCEKRVETTGQLPNSCVQK
jgi:hypothetical protein